MIQLINLGNNPKKVNITDYKVIIFIIQYLNKKDQYHNYFIYNILSFTNNVIYKINHQQQQMSLRKFWPFRNKVNFAFSVLVCSGFGIFYYTARKQKSFTGNPIVIQGVKFMNQNIKLKNLLGYPMVYHRSIHNTSSNKQNQKYYYFLVKGSKSQTNVQLIATKKKIAELKDDMKNVEEMKNKIVSCQKQIKILENKRDTLKKQKKKKQQIQQQKKQLQTTIQTLQTQLSKMRHQQFTMQNICNQQLTKYYIPQLDMYAKCMKNQTPTNELNDDQYLYGIQQLVANLPNQNKIDVIVSKKNKQQLSEDNDSKDSKLSLQNYHQVKFNQAYLRTRIKEGLGQLSEQELQSYGKHKTQMMYSGAYGGHRMLFMFLGVIGIAFSIYYFHQNRLQTIAGTTIARNIQIYFKNVAIHHKAFDQIKIDRKNLKVGKLFVGGKSGNNFKCSVDIVGFNGAQINFQGTEKADGKLQFSKFQVEYKDNKEIKKINLLS